jgi:sodium transport system ATP-binding protein
MIQAEQLAKRFEQGTGSKKKIIDAVKDVSFTALNGRITGLLGPNGAGKTTSLRMIGTLFEPDHGRILVDGVDVSKEPASALAKMGLLSDSRGLYPRLTARENIAYYGRLRGMSELQVQSRIGEMSKMFDLPKLLDRRTDGFSQGEKMRTALARALVHDPHNIVLDEPTNGLDVLATRSLRESLSLLRELGKCIVFSSHIMQEVERLCDEVVIVANGKTLVHGTVESIKEQAGLSNFEDAFVRLAF